ncbi:hypothetical protein JCM11251_007339 [Rhodosporidiobolus azoricus]
MQTNSQPLPAFTALKQAVEGALSTEDHDEWQVLAAQARGYMNGPAHLLDLLTKVQLGTMKGAEETKAVFLRVQDVLLTEESLSAKFSVNQTQQQQPDTRGQDVRKAVTSFALKVADKTFDEKTEPAQIIRWLRRLLATLPLAARNYEEEGDATAVPPVLPYCPTDPLPNLALLCESSRKATAWWATTGSKLTWEKCCKYADEDATIYTAAEESDVFAELKENVKKFNWFETYKTEDGGLITAGTQFAMQLAKIIRRSPSHIREEANQWAYTDVLNEFLPNFVIRNVPANVAAGKDTKAYLKAVGNIPRNLFTREIQDYLAKDARIEALAGQVATLASRVERKDRESRQTYATPKFERTVEVQVKAEKPAYVPKVLQDGPALAAPELNPFVNSTTPSGWKPDRAANLTFEDSAEGREKYKAAMSNFMKTHGTKVTSLSPDVKFPLTPGTSLVPSFSCDNCGMRGHTKRNCSGKALPAGERYYRNIWRAIVTQHRRGLPSYAKAGHQVNLIADIADHIANEDIFLCAEPDEGWEDDDELTQEDKDMFVFLIENGQGKDFE